MNLTRPSLGLTYFEVQSQPLNVTEKQLARIFDQVRFDPRLMEVATEHIRDFWWNIHPYLLNQELKKNRFPESIKPALSAIFEYCEFLDAETKSDFIAWFKVVASGLPSPNRPQLFYIGVVSAIGGKVLNREESESLTCFTQHNLFAKDRPFNKGLAKHLKSKQDLKATKFDHLHLIKYSLAYKIKDLKYLHRLTSAQVAKYAGINHAFLSKILNNQLDGITLDYLVKKVAVLEEGLDQPSISL